MAVVTPAAPAATEEDKELLISGSEAVAEAPDPRRPGRRHRVSDPAVRHRHAGDRQEDLGRPAGSRVHRGRGRAQPVRDRQARLDRRRARLLRLVRCRLDVRDGVPRGHAAAARADGGPRRQPRPRRSGRVRRRAQRRAGGPRRRLDALLDRHLARGARHHPDRLPCRRGPPRVPAAGHLGGRRVPHALPGADDGAAEVEGRPVPAALRPRRSPAAPGQPDHGRASGQRGLGHRDPPPEQRGDGSRRHRDRRGVRRLPPCLRPRSGESVVRGIHDR